MAPKEFEIIETYVFSGKFEVPINFADIEKLRVLYADIQVVRKPKSPFFSNKTNPVNGFLGTFTTNIDGLTLRRYDIEFEKCRFILFGADIDTQQIYAARCYDALDTARLIVAVAELGGTLGSAQAPFSRDLTALSVPFDSLLFKCYADTALSVTLGRLDVLECTTEYPFETPPPPKPPAPPVPPFYPPTVPISGEDYSPIPEGTDPNNYEPFPGDAPEEPGDFPQGENCVAYRVTLNYDFFSGQNITDFNDFWGEIWGFRFRNEPSGSILEVDCFGLTNAACSVRDWYRFTSSGSPDAFSNVTLVSIEPI